MFCSTFLIHVYSENNLDISKAKVTEGRGYSYNYYPENKKYGGWLSKYQTGGWDNWTPNVGKPYLRTSPAGNAGLIVKLYSVVIPMS